MVASVRWSPSSSQVERAWSDLVIAGCAYEIVALLSHRTDRLPDLPTVSELVGRAKGHRWLRFAGFVWDLAWDIHFLGGAREITR